MRKLLLFFAMLCVSVGTWAAITITPDPNPYNQTWIGAEQISNFKVFTISGWDNPGDVAKLLNGDTSLDVNWNGKSLSDLQEALIIYIGSGANTDLLNDDDLKALDLLTSTKYLDLDGSKLAASASINNIEIGSAVEGVVLPDGLSKNQVNAVATVLSANENFGSCISKKTDVIVAPVTNYYYAEGSNNGQKVVESATVVLDKENLKATVKENVQYRLTVIADNKTYRSDWIEPTAPPEITDVNFTADNTQVYVRVSLEDHGQGSGYASASFEEIWKFHTDYVRLYGYIPETNSVHMLMYPDESHIWCWRKNILGYSYNIDYSALDGVVKDYSIFHFLRTSDRNHQEYNIRVKVWNLTPEQYRFRKILEENESIGGDLFSPEPGEVRGNVYCEDDENEKVFGYVNVSRVAMKDAKLNSRYDLWTAPKSLIEVAPEDYLDFYNNGYNPVEQIPSAEGGMVVGWGLGRCYDCVLAGGTLEKPSFE